MVEYTQMFVYDNKILINGEKETIKKIIQELNKIGIKTNIELESMCG